MTPPRTRAADPARDEVDALVGRWREERPDIDPAPLEVFSRVSRLAVLADRERREAFASHGLELWEFDVLSALRRAGSPYALTPGALLRATLVTSATMTHRVDRLVAGGLVTRGPDPDDRRGVLVQLTFAGRARVDAALESLVQHEDRLLQPLAKAERRDLAALLRRLLLPLEG
ncbi:MAG TPA: MarR family transcriptional regulator [Mycobacteriales bacterium]